MARKDSELLERRGFLKGAAVGGIAAAVAPLASAAEQSTAPAREAPNHVPCTTNV